MKKSYFFNHPDRKKLRQKLRNEVPKAEIVLWNYLKGKRLNGLKFRRQYGIGPYVVDFYCPSLRLAIEVDGPSHYEDGAEGYDRARQQYIESFNIQFLRFTNTDIYINIESVLDVILLEVMKNSC